jgi:hypothetical protein
MAKVILNTAFARASGRVGDVELRRHRGTTVLQKRQERRAPWSARQGRHRAVFKTFAAYASVVRDDATA